MPGKLVSRAFSRAGLYCGFLLLIARLAAAVPACPLPVWVQQPDGTRLHVTLHGDEHRHWTEDANGLPIIREHGSHRWVYQVVRDGRLALTGIPAGNRTTAEAGGVRPVSPQQLPLNTQRTASATLASPLSYAPISGTMKNLVVLVNFSDTAISYAASDYDALFNRINFTADGAIGSVKDYFHEVSNNALTVQSTVAGPVTLDNPMAYYGANDSNGDDVRPREMVSEALAKLAASGFDFSTMDGNGDGWIDGLTVIHAGGGEEYSGNDENYIWSHKWDLTASVSYNGVKMQTYHTEPARRGWDSSPSTQGITRIGVICHETSHFLGLPDLYDYTYTSRGVGDFCLMGGGSWNGNYGTSPSHLSAWCKMQLGWVTPATITASGAYPLPRIEGGQTLYKLARDTWNPREYFLIENRQGQGFDAGLPGTQRGILIWHIDENIANNNDKTHYLVDLEEASGTQHLTGTTSDGDDADYFRDGNAIAFTQSSTPNNLSYAGDLLYTDINNIGTTGATMTFSATVAPQLQVVTTALPNGSVGLPYAATLEATGGTPPYAWFALSDRYRESAGTATWQGGGSAMGWRADDNAWTCTLPWAFPFYGQQYTSLRICSNGYVDLAGTTIDWSPTEAELQTSVRIAACWLDLVTTGTGDDIYLTQAGDRLVIRWAAHTYSGATPVNVELTLHRNGAISLYYGTGLTGKKPVVGISKGDNAHFLLASMNRAVSIPVDAASLFTPITLEDIGLAVTMDGIVQGIPSADGVFTLLAGVQDSAVPAQSTSRSLTIDIPHAPVITGFAPTSGQEGDAITITGSYFTTVTGVRFHGSESTFTVDSDTRITATVPATATTGPLSVQNGGGTAESGMAFTVLIPNTPPSFTRGRDLRILRTAGPQTITGWATAISPGPPTEAGQTVDFLVTADLATCFSAQPAIDAAGTLTFTPNADASGTAIVTVRLHDDGGGTDTSAPQTFTITLCDPLSGVTLAADPANVPMAGQSLAYTATATGGANPEYAFLVTLKDILPDLSHSEQVILEDMAFSASPVRTFTAHDPGRYAVTVSVREAVTTEPTFTRTLNTLAGSDTLTGITAFTANMTSGVALPDISTAGIRLTATITGTGEGVEYFFSATLRDVDAAGTATSVPVAVSTAWGGPAVAWHPADPGYYTLRVTARDATCNLTYSRYLTFLVRSGALKGLIFAASPATGAALNILPASGITLTATPQGTGTGVEYFFSGVFKTKPDGTAVNAPLTLSPAWSTARTFAWLPSEPGAYLLTLTARDASYNTTISKTMNYQLRLARLVGIAGLSADPPSGVLETDIPAGGILLTTNPSPVNASVEYFYAAKRRIFRTDGSSTDVAESISTAWSPAAACAWHPSHPGLYLVTITVRDTIFQISSRVTINYLVRPASLTRLLGVSASPPSGAVETEVSGEGITLAAIPEGSGAGAHYFFSARLKDVQPDGSTAIVPVVLSTDWSTARTFAWHPSIPGSYTVTVVAKDADCVVTFSKNLVYLLKSAAVTGIAAFAPNTPSGLPLSDLPPAGVTFIATVAGTGAGVQYRYQVGISNGASYVYQPLTDFTTDGTFTFTPATAGTYRLWVYASDPTYNTTCSMYVGYIVK